MQAAATARHPTVSTLTDPIDAATRGRPLDVAAVHAAHADFVWRSLHRLGVREPDLPDMLQEVFVVVHRRQDSYDGQARLTTWLFGICMRVAAAYHRRAWRRRERPTDLSAPETELDGGAVSIPPSDPERAAELSQARARLATILDQMDLDKRAVFVMYELEGVSCGEIAALLDVPVGTIHSRLHSARKFFADAAAKLGAREGKGGTR